VTALWLGHLFFKGEWTSVLLGLFVIIGHNYPIWLHFRGGKGVGPMMGIILWLAPIQTAFAFVVAFLVFMWKKKVNIATPAGIVFYIGSTWETKYHQQVLVFFFGFALLLALAYYPRFMRWIRTPRVSHTRY
jgi:glycerol-3-phosphate acyltransferase PlsY